MVESVDTRDLKSLAGNSVPVQVWPRVPKKKKPRYLYRGFFAFVLDVSCEYKKLDKMSGEYYFLLLIEISLYAFKITHKYHIKEL